ncbi:MAG: hypothetical protein BGO28_04530 [Alphaproteobacteria bacterium 43-37]|nr:MAG: hypothetical protein BGO28_04530 [Alphaproteobacteria bacterium 43-37]
MKITPYDIILRHCHQPNTFVAHKIQELANYLIFHIFNELSYDAGLIEIIYLWHIRATKIMK